VRLDWGSWIGCLAAVLSLVACTGKDKGADAMQVPDAGTTQLPDAGVSVIANDSGGSVPPERSDSGEASPSQDSVTFIGSGTESCAGDGEAVELEMVPSRARSFWWLPAAPCESLSVGLLVRNNKATAARIIGLAIDLPDFSIASDALPRDIQPGASFEVAVSYRGNDALGLTLATLTVATLDGCSTFQVRGLAASEGGLITYTPAAIDFGDVEVGTVSEPRTVRILRQYRESTPASTFDGFGVGRSDVFELISAPPPASQLASCEELQIQLRFRAPEAPGSVESLLGWSVTIESAEGASEGLQGVPLFGRAVSPTR
jgi:hypothetical protein